MTNQELNEAIARKLGWQSFAVQPMDMSGPKENRWVGPLGGEHFRDVPDYAGSILACWEIVESLLDKKLDFKLKWDIELTTDKWKWFCVIAGGKSEADTALMAIALAFLKLS